MGKTRSAEGPPPSSKAAAKKKKQAANKEAAKKKKDEKKKPEETTTKDNKDESTTTTQSEVAAASQPSRRDSIEAANTLTGLATTLVAGGRPAPNMPPPFMFPPPTAAFHQPAQPQDEFQAALQMAKLKPSRSSTARLPPKAPPTKVTWKEDMDQQLREAVLLHGYDNWSNVGKDMKLEADECQNRWNYITGRSAQELEDPYALLRPEPKKKKKEDEQEEEDEESKERKKRSRWTKEEDDQLKKLVEQYGSGSQSWMSIAEKMPCRRSNQIRDRWVYHLDPNIDTQMRTKPFTMEEDLTILRCLATVGTKWAVMQRMMPSRNDLQIRNHFNSALRKYQRKMAKDGDKTTAKSVTILNKDRLLDLETVDLEQFLNCLRARVSDTERSEIHILVDKLKDELKNRQAKNQELNKRKPIAPTFMPAASAEWGIGSPQAKKKRKTDNAENNNDVMVNDENKNDETTHTTVSI